MRARRVLVVVHARTAKRNSRALVKRTSRKEGRELRGHRTGDSLPSARGKEGNDFKGGQD